MPISRGMDKDVILLYNSMLLDCKKECTGAIAGMWMDLETVIQSEVNQKEKDKYHIISLTYGI